MSTDSRERGKHIMGPRDLYIKRFLRDRSFSVVTDHHQQQRKKKGSNLFSSLPLISHLSCEGTVFHCLAKWTIMPPSIRPKPKWPLTDKPALFFTQNPPVSGFPSGACLALLTIMCCTSRHVREGLKNQTQ